VGLATLDLENPGLWTITPPHKRLKTPTPGQTMYALQQTF